VRFIKLLYERSGCLEQPSEYIRSLGSHPASKSHNEASAITALRRESKQESAAKQHLYSALDTAMDDGSRPIDGGCTVLSTPRVEAFQAVIHSCG
jgi:hypothetical protein